MRVCILIVAVMFAASGALAQAGLLGMYNFSYPPADPSTDCFLPDNVSGLCSYYVVHMFTAGARGAQFAAPAPSCFTAVWISDTANYPVTIGDSQTGVTVMYGACIGSSNNILVINFFCQGTTPACCEYPILPHPDATSGKVLVEDCNGDWHQTTAYSGFINGRFPGCCCNCFGPAEPSTWGRVKAIYTIGQSP